MPRRDPSDPNQLYVFEVDLIQLAAERSDDEPPGFYGYEAAKILNLGSSSTENGTIYRALYRLATHGFLVKQEITVEDQGQGQARRRYTLGAKGAELLVGRVPITYI